MSTSTVQLRLEVVGDAALKLRKINTEQITAAQRLKPLTADQVNQNRRLVGELQKQVSTFQKQRQLLQANELTRRLGLRTEQSINNEIRKTHSQYQKLAILQRQGAVSANDMQRAYGVMTQKVAQLNRELGKTTQIEKTIQQSHSTGGMSRLQKGAMVAGAVVGAGYALQRPVRDAMQYEKDLAQLSITAYDNPNDRKAGQDRLRSIITSTAKQYGQTTDDVLTGLSSLVASGKYKGANNAETEAMLRTALSASGEAAQASGGDILDFTQMSISAKGKGLNEREYMSYAVQAGKEGNFETRDLAKFLPKQFGMLASDPANQNRQASQLMALNQVAMTTAGSADDAGNNVVNLLSKMNAEGTKKTFKKDYGIDLEAEYLKGAEDGKTRFEVFGEALSRAMKKDDRYNQLIADLSKTSNSGERQLILESQQGILQQSALSNILPDMQALSAGVAMVTQWDELQRISQANQDKGLQSMTEDSATMRDTASYGANQFSVTKKNTEFEALEGFNSKLGDLGSNLSKYADQYPDLTKAVGVATVAISALAVAAGGASLGGLVTGGGSGKSTGGGGLRATGGGASNIVKKGGQVLVAGAIGYEIGTQVRNLYTQTETGRNFDDWMGENIAKSLAFFGNETAQQAVEAQAKYDEMIAQQEAQSKHAASQIQLLQSLNQNILGLANRPVNINGGSMLDAVSGASQKESNRHGTVPYSPLIFRN